MDNMIEVSPAEYRQLLQIEAKAQSLMAYVNCTKYSVDRKIIGGILGFTVNEVKDGTD